MGHLEAMPAGPFRHLILLACSMALFLTPSSRAQERPLPEEGRVLYRPVPDLRMTSSRGETFGLAERWRTRPLILTLVFASCVQICPPYLHSLRAAIDTVGGAGEDYDVIVLSFDARDSPGSMARLARRLELEASPGWTLAVAEPVAVERLAEAIGFWSAWDGRSQFDHPAMLAGIADGRVVRLLVGATVPRQRLREVLWELRGEFVPSYAQPSKSVLFRCFDFDPATGAVTLEWGLLLSLIHI